MIYKIIHTILSLAGMISGFFLARNVIDQPWLPTLLGHALTDEVRIIIYVLCVIICGFILYTLFPLVHKGLKKLAAYIEESLENVRMADILISLGGLAIGLLLARLLSFALALIPIEWISTLAMVIVYILFGYLGFTLALHKRDDILNIFQRGSKEKENPVTLPTKKSKKRNVALPKLLDTSSIIDGRIADVLGTGFIEGQLIVPTFVLTELQTLADASDTMKHSRGRRGLEILQNMQADFGDMITVSETDYDDVVGVDAKLVKMAKEKKAAILTTDYNLNQVATVQGISVLNINELSGCLKPVVMPGERIDVLPIKNGKEAGQAIAYTDDGTMIVVENGRKSIGEKIAVIVTSVLQTPAGRMIFAKPLHEH